MTISGKRKTSIAVKTALCVVTSCVGAGIIGQALANPVYLRKVIATEGNMNAPSVSPPAVPPVSPPPASPPPSPPPPPPVADCGSNPDKFFVSQSGTGDCSASSPCDIATAQANIGDNATLVLTEDITTTATFNAPSIEICTSSALGRRAVWTMNTGSTDGDGIQSQGENFDINGVNFAGDASPAIRIGNPFLTFRIRNANFENSGAILFAFLGAVGQSVDVFSLTNVAGSQPQSGILGDIAANTPVQMPLSITNSTLSYVDMKFGSNIEGNVNFANNTVNTVGQSESLQFRTGTRGGNINIYNNSITSDSGGIKLGANATSGFISRFNFYNNMYDYTGGGDSVWNQSLANGRHYFDIYSNDITSNGVGISWGDVNSTGGTVQEVRFHVHDHDTGNNKITSSGRPIRVVYASGNAFASGNFLVNNNRLFRSDGSSSIMDISNFNSGNGPSLNTCFAATGNSVFGDNNDFTFNFNRGGSNHNFRIPGVTQSQLENNNSPFVMTNNGTINYNTGSACPVP